MRAKHDSAFARKGQHVEAISGYHLPLDAIATLDKVRGKELPYCQFRTGH
jgi:hypothetical protein